MNRKRFLGALVFVAFVGCAGGGRDLQGMLELHGDDSSIAAHGGSCDGTGGYGDITEGTDVTVRDEDGSLIASGNLEKGTSAGAGSSIVCTFLYEVNDVPDAEFYEIEVADRGGLTYSRDELEEQNWIVSGTIGTD